MNAAPTWDLMRLVRLVRAEFLSDGTQ